MNRVFALRSGLNITLNINGAYSTLVFDTEEEAIEVFLRASQVKANPTDENIKELQDFVDPSFRVMDSGILERDRAGNYFLKGYNMALPYSLVSKVKEYATLGLPLIALENFWKLCMLNPDDRARQDLFSFADRFHFPITDSGYFIAYKSVEGINMKHKEFGLFVAQEYINMVAAMKEYPADYTIIRTGEFHNDYAFSRIKISEMDKWLEGKVLESDITLESDAERWMEENHNVEFVSVGGHLEIEAFMEYARKLGYQDIDITEKFKKTHFVTEMGNLNDLFIKLNELFEQEEMSFTDWHTKRMSIKLGQVVQMDRNKCDSDPYQTCSTGLHVGAPGYVKGFNGSSSRFILACLVNPTHVVAVPEDYSFEKMRCCEYYPYAVCEVSDNGYLKELQTPYFEANYCGYEMSQLEVKLRETQRCLNESVGLTPEEEAELQAQSDLIINRLFLIGDAAILPEALPEAVV